MAKTAFTSVDEYIAMQPAELQSILRRVRSAIRKAVPDAGRVLYFAGWKQHYSLYPATGHLVAALKDDLAPFTVSKGTIRFPLSQPVPVKLIERIAKFRAKEAATRARTKGAAPTRRRT